ncbi:ABC transporter permease [Vallitalea okinawensis]|uniref:ABC transporter permease n=1 Tax=Vallitalea okinawensis TaxID=2078660 RepID=UPI000CFCC379|nr:ABC transporter permease [Vallitalea okinawensis]
MEFIQFIIDRKMDILVALTQHIKITFFAVALAILIGVPIGILITRNEKVANFIIGFANILQTLPSLALFGIMLPLLGIGMTNAVFVLFLYALLPIIKNTYLGIKSVDPSIRESARGMGMTTSQILRIVEIPLALPVIMGGIRISTVINIGTATIANFIGAGGLGDLIYKGISMVNYNLILAGAIPTAILALLADGGLGLLENTLTSKGIKVSSK